ncbi:metallophosphoesterase family protein [Martelella endophytica]|uniref:Metallophosphatase n=1 Tax=Martelella endophytica TaxID=1486262 RepID=A0A0D5LRK6_MAREN|nr:metallophosphoesterase [Martelella endophytica]AJY45968.1 metallophosphatase [Martelella endophytica]
MFTLAHISDVHLGPLPQLSPRELFSKRITGFFNWQRNRKKQLGKDTLENLLLALADEAPDHLAITGDLVNLATKTEIENAGEWLKSVGPAHEVSLIPGNHDAYVGGAYARVCRAWHDYMLGDDAAGQDEAPIAFPYLRRRGPVAIIGCSSAVPSPPFLAIGTFERKQARKTAELLKQAGEEGLFRIVMIHHPPVRNAAARHKRLIGIRRFRAAISTGGCELVLHGHTHLNTVNFIETPQGKTPVIGIAAAGQGTGGKKPPSAFNMISVSGKPGQWEMHCRRHALSAESGAIEPESEFRFSYAAGSSA